MPDCSGLWRKLTGSMPRLPVSVTVPCWPAMICPFHWQRVGPHRRAVEAMRYSQHAVRRIGEPAAPLPVDSTPLAGRVVDSQWITSRLSTVGRLRDTQTTDRQRSAGVGRLRNPQTTDTEPISTAPTSAPQTPQNHTKGRQIQQFPSQSLVCEGNCYTKRLSPSNEANQRIRCAQAASPPLQRQERSPCCHRCGCGSPWCRRSRSRGRPRRSAARRSARRP